MTQTKSKNDTKNESFYKAQIKELKKNIEDLNSVVNALLKQNLSTSNMQNYSGDRDVTFISLCNHILNLSTEPNGGGTIYTFYEFGEEQSIPYSDARKIIKNNKSFVKGGKCYIADDEIIKAEHLDRDYKKILNKDSLLELFSLDRKKFKEIFDIMTKTQKEIFRDIVVDKLMKDKNSVDMNIVQYINESLNINILEMVDYSKSLLNSDE